MNLISWHASTDLFLHLMSRSIKLGLLKAKFIYGLDCFVSAISNKYSFGLLQVFKIKRRTKIVHCRINSFTSKTLFFKIYLSKGKVSLDGKQYGHITLCKIPLSLDVGHQFSRGSTHGILSLIYRLVKN